MGGDFEAFYYRTGALKKYIAESLGRSKIVSIGENANKTQLECKVQLHAPGAENERKYVILIIKSTENYGAFLEESRGLNEIESRTLAACTQHSKGWHMCAMKMIQDSFLNK